MSELKTAFDVEIYIDSEFKKLLPAHSEHERKEMIAEIESSGCFPGTLCCWKDPKGSLTLMDGHNRYEYWLGLPDDTPIAPPQIEEISLPDRAAAIKWIIRHQVGRRNLNPSQMSAFRGRLYNSAKPQSGQHSSSAKVAEEGPASASEVAKETGVSERTIHNDSKYATALDAIKKTNRRAGDRIESGDIKLPKKDVIAIGGLSKADMVLAIKNLNYGTPWRENIDFGEDAESGTDSLGDSPPETPGNGREPKDGPGDSESTASKTPEQLFSEQKSKTVKTVEALMRAFDDLHRLKRAKKIDNSGLFRGLYQCINQIEDGKFGDVHEASIFVCKLLLETAKNWK